MCTSRGRSVTGRRSYSERIQFDRAVFTDAARCPLGDVTHVQWRCRARGSTITHHRHRTRRAGRHGVAMVEFALVAPIAFLILLGIVITGIAVSNQIALSNGVRDAVRAAAVCGGNIGPRDLNTQLPSTNGQAAQTCSWANFQTYISARLSKLAGAGTVSPPTGSFAGNTNCAAVAAAEVCLYKSDGTAVALSSSNPLDLCQKGYKIEVSSQYGQPLFIPLVGRFLGSNGSTSTRNLTADAQATCEQ